jgi:hypothetical protein
MKREEFLKAQEFNAVIAAKDRAAIHGRCSEITSPPTPR